MYHKARERTALKIFRVGRIIGVEKRLLLMHSKYSVIQWVFSVYDYSIEELNWKFLNMVYRFFGRKVDQWPRVGIKKQLNQFRE